MYERPSIRKLVWLGTVLPIACLIALGAVVACATGPTLPPLPPVPGPGFNDWPSARAPDGGVRG